MSFEHARQERVDRLRARAAAALDARVVRVASGIACSMRPMNSSTRARSLSRSAFTRLLLEPLGSLAQGIAHLAVPAPGDAECEARKRATDERASRAPRPYPTADVHPDRVDLGVDLGHVGGPDLRACSGARGRAAPSGGLIDGCTLPALIVDALGGDDLLALLEAQRERAGLGDARP